MTQLSLAISNEKTTQCDDLLLYLNTHGSIRPMNALFELGIYRLAARIYDLEKKGHRIPRNMVTGIAKNGRRYAVMEYYKPV